MPKPSDVVAAILTDISVRSTSSDDYNPFQVATGAGRREFFEQSVIIEGDPTDLSQELFGYRITLTLSGDWSPSRENYSRLPVEPHLSVTRLREDANEFEEYSGLSRHDERSILAHYFSSVKPSVCLVSEKSVADMAYYVSAVCIAAPDLVIGCAIKVDLTAPRRASSSLAVLHPGSEIMVPALRQIAATFAFATAHLSSFERMHDVWAPLVGAAYSRELAGQPGVIHAPFSEKIRDDAKKIRLVVRTEDIQTIAKAEKSAIPVLDDWSSPNAVKRKL